MLIVVVHVFAQRKYNAEAWVRAAGLRPRDCDTYGDNSMWPVNGLRIQPGDRVVVVGSIGYRANRSVSSAVIACDEPRPIVERVSWPVLIG